MTRVRWYHRLWWRFAWPFRVRWIARPRVYAHNSALKKANAFTRARLRWLARVMAYASYPREHHRDLLTGMVVALTTGVRFQNVRGRPGPFKYGASTKGAKLVGKPAVYEYRVEPRDPRDAQDRVRAGVRISRIGLTEWLDLPGEVTP